MTSGDLDLGLWVIKHQSYYFPIYDASFHHKWTKSVQESRRSLRTHKQPYTHRGATSINSIDIILFAYMNIRETDMLETTALIWTCSSKINTYIWPCSHIKMTGSLETSICYIYQSHLDVIRILFWWQVLVEEYIAGVEGGSLFLMCLLHRLFLADTV